MEKVWVLLLVGYLLVIRTAERRNAAGAVLCFWRGAYLAMLCFAVWPPAMGAARFWGAAGCAAAGCGTGFLVEKYLPWDVLLRRALFLFSDGGGLLPHGRFPYFRWHFWAAWGCIMPRQAFCLSLFPYETHFSAQAAFLQEYFSFRRYCSRKKEKFAAFFFLV